MRATRESVKKFFLKPRELEASNYVQDALERYRQALYSVTKTTASLTGMPGGGGSDKALQLAKYMDTEQQVKVALELLNQAKKDCEHLIRDALLTERQRKILYDRFVLFKACKSVADELGISKRQLYRDEDAGFDSCAAYITLARPTYAIETLTYIDN